MTPPLDGHYSSLFGWLNFFAVHYHSNQVGIKLIEVRLGWEIVLSM